jgi:SlyX protein
MGKIETAEDPSARIDALETRIAHQDQVIADLNEVITAQWRKIDLLERLLAHVRDEVQSMAQPRGAPEPPPPHY